MSKESMVERLKSVKKKGSGVYSSVLEKLHEIKDSNSPENSMPKLQTQQDSDFQVLNFWFTWCTKKA